LDASTIYSQGIPSLSTPVFIQGITRLKPSRSVSDLLIDHTNAIQFAQLYSPHFPDYLEAAADGIGHLPHYDFYASTRYDPSLVLLVGDQQLLPSVAAANYEVFTAIITFIKNLGCTQIVSYGYFSPERVKDTIYVGATSEALTTEITQTVGGRVLPEGQLRTAVGLILGLAQQLELPGICVLKPIFGRHPPDIAVLSMFNYLLTLIQVRSEAHDPDSH
jgi:proteasome assembly chaperone (PAC2) family protein